jgi:hypothetical protein
MLELLWPRGQSRRALLALGFRLWRRLRRGAAASDAELERLHTTAVTVRSLQPVCMAVDGEVQSCPGPLHFRYRGMTLPVMSLLDSGQP